MKECKASASESRCAKPCIRNSIIFCFCGEWIACCWLVHSVGVIACLSVGAHSVGIIACLVYHLPFSVQCGYASHDLRVLVSA